MSPKQENTTVRTGISISRELLNRADEAMKKTEARSRSDFIAEALEFYMAWLHSEETSKVLTPALESVISGRIGDTENRIARVLFKQSVELAMLMHVVAATHRYSDSKEWWSDYYKLARKYLYGNKDEKPDFQKAMPLLLLEANRGNGYACYDLGRMHLLGQGCEEDEEEAQRWFRDASEAFQATEKKGYLRYRIGKCHAYGHGIEQNYEESAKWFQQAVDENNPFAAYSLAGQYLRGQGVEQSDAEAYSLYLMAATHEKQSNAYAQYQLGKMHRDGSVRRSIWRNPDYGTPKRWNIWKKQCKRTMPLPSTSLESCCVRVSWCQRISPEVYLFWRNWQRTASHLAPILLARSISRKKAGRISKRPSPTSNRRQRMAILLRNISWVGSTTSETEFVRTGKRVSNI